MTNENTEKSRAVLKSSALIGGSAFVNIFIGMIRTKFVAVLLGPTGVGLLNVYLSIVAPISAVSILGLNSSGVREIVEVRKEDNPQRFAAVVISLLQLVWFAGLLGFIATVILSPWLSWYTFQNYEHVAEISILGSTVFLANIAYGRKALLQGKRMILEIAKVSVFSALYGVLVSIPCFLLWGKGGIIPSLVLTSIAALFTSVWFARKIKIANIQLAWSIRLNEMKKMLRFGLPVMGVALQGACVAYFIRLIILNQFGLSGVGVWSAAFAISGILVNFVLNSMATDYYPRLTVVSSDNKLIEKEVNTQLKIALFLALPALVITIIFAPLGINILYSGKFDEAILILRWSVYGILGRVISWPLAFVMLAKGRGKLFFFTDLISNTFYLIFVYLCCEKWGLIGTGIAFMFNYLIYIFGMIFVVRQIAKTNLSISNTKLILCVIATLILSSCLHIFIVNSVIYYIVAILLTLIVVLSSFHYLSKLSGITFKAILSRLKF